MRNDSDLLLDVLDAIEAIERYSSYGKERYESNELIQVWIVHHLQIIGEAGRLLSKEIQIREPSIPWKGIIGVRNILVHQYSSVDPSLIWEMVQNDLPELKEKIERLMEGI